MSKASDAAKRKAKARAKKVKSLRRKRPNPSFKNPVNIGFDPLAALGMIAMGVSILFPDVINKILDLKDEREQDCDCLCHKPRFDSMPDGCRCSKPLAAERLHFGRLADTNGIQTFCHKCYCLKQCGGLI